MSVMNSRRLIGFLLTLGRTLPHRCLKTVSVHYSKIDRRMAEMGHFRQIDTLPTPSGMSASLRLLPIIGTALHAAAAHIFCSRPAQ
jgi:hypothetical protein